MAGFVWLRQVKIMLLLAAAGSVLISPVAGQVSQAPIVTDQAVLYRNVTLIDGTDRPPRAGMDVLVRGERIVSIYPNRSPKPAISAGARAVDLEGKFLLPGLIDTHVHLATPPHREQAEAVLRRDLFGGVTSVRDMADDTRSVGELARASLADEIPAPDIYYAALMAGPAFFTDERTAMTAFGGTPGHVPWMQAVTNDTDLPIAVAVARGTYAAAIKLYAAIDAGLAARITGEAHRQKLQVWAHATLYPAKPWDVVTAGVDAISHSCLLVRESTMPVPQWSQPRRPADINAFKDGNNKDLARLFAEMRRRGTVLDATIWTYGPPPDAPKGPAPPGICDDKVGGVITAQAFRAGVAISAGTDSVAPWNDLWPDVFHELLALNQKAHMPASAVIIAATLNGARAIGRDKDIGSIEVGKLANMIILDRNPLNDLENLKSVVATIKRGKSYARSSFVPLREADLLDNADSS